jgi:hypothetical protein
MRTQPRCSYIDVQASSGRWVTSGSLFRQLPSGLAFPISEFMTVAIIPATGLFRQLTGDGCISWRLAGSWVHHWRNNQSVFRKAKTRPAGWYRGDRHKMADVVMKRIRREHVLLIPNSMLLSCSALVSKLGIFSQLCGDG